MRLHTEMKKGEKVQVDVHGPEYLNTGWLDKQCATASFQLGQLHKQQYLLYLWIDLDNQYPKMCALARGSYTILNGNPNMTSANINIGLKFRC